MTDSIRIGVIGGSGLGDVLLEGVSAEAVESHWENTPFGLPSGPIVTGTFREIPIALLKRHGDGHVFNPATVPYRANIYALKVLGCTHLIASGACGSLREDVAPGDLVICDQTIDRTEGRPRTFYERAAVHVEFAEPFCPVMRSWLLSAAVRLEGTTVHETGTYVCMEGPGFSTRAESHLHRKSGADVVGMTALPEARLAREAEMAYALVALPTDYDCWRARPDDGASSPESLLKEIIGNLQHATDACIALLKVALADISLLRQSDSPAHDALRLAIWSNKSEIKPAEIRRLNVLWGRHFESLD